MKPKEQKLLTEARRMQQIKSFIQNFEEHADQAFSGIQPAYTQKWGKKKYMIQLQMIKQEVIADFQVLFEDFRDFVSVKSQTKPMADEIIQNCVSYERKFLEVIAQLLDKITVILDAPTQKAQMRKFDKILQNQRRDNYNQATSVKSDFQHLPANLHRKYQVSLRYSQETKKQSISLHEITGSQFGSLIILKGIIIKASDVKPRIVVATYTCDSCGCQNYVQVNNFSHNPIVNCRSDKCRTNKIQGKLTFLPGHSNFTSYQEIKLQQTSEQLRIGNIPKTIKMVVEGVNVNCANVGDVIQVQGVVLPERKQNQRSKLNLELTAFIKANYIKRFKKKYLELFMTEQQEKQLQSQLSILKSKQFIKKLSTSIAPEIYGLQQVKKAILYQMVGGQTKITPDKARIRGEINIAIIGDPGIAKSQLLKHVTKIAPRGVYTTGKGSSGVGLTAAVVSDSVTKQLSLEAGALVLADTGICCIDQFDKMHPRDQTAIHEVMQQQIVSIAKAGITTTLNARCAVLAAANPIYGRYRKNSTKSQNINMPTSLLTRFDLIFILLDQPNSLRDLELAHHILKVHQTGSAIKQQHKYDESFIRKYIAKAKTYNPYIRTNLVDKFVQNYIEKRKSSLQSDGREFVSSRYLLALIRLATARARLRFSTQVIEEDLEDVVELMDDCDKSVRQGTQRNMNVSKNAQEVDLVFNAVKRFISDQMYKTGENKVEILELQKFIQMNGYSWETYCYVLEFYEMTQIFQSDGRYISFYQEAQSSK